MIEKILAESFGCQEDDPKVKKALEALHKAVHIDIKKTDNALRNREIYDLRASGLKVREIGQRFGLSRQTCHVIIRDELLRRRG